MKIQKPSPQTPPQKARETHAGICKGAVAAMLSGARVVAPLA